MITLAKLGDDVPEINPGAGMNDGTGTLRILGGVPLRKINGALIRVGGMQYAGRRIVWVAIEPVMGVLAQTTLISADGVEHSVGDVGTVGTLRGQWLRRTTGDGTFAGVARMR